MNILPAIQSAITALRLGHELRDAAAWKNRQTVVNLLSALLALAVAFGFSVSVTEDTLSVIAAVLMALANAYFTLATSSKVGIAPPLSPTPMTTGAPNEKASIASQPPRTPPVCTVKRVRDPLPPAARDRPKPFVPVDKPTQPNGWNDR